MTKRDRQRILKAMEKVSTDSGLVRFCCNAIQYDTAYNALYEISTSKNLSLRERFEYFYEVHPDNISASDGWFGPVWMEENQNARLTALALFLVAEKDMNYEKIK